MSTTNFVQYLRLKMLGFESYSLSLPMITSGWNLDFTKLSIPIPNALKYFLMANFGLSVFNFARSKF